MVGVREHVYRLNGLHFIFRIEQLQVARLRSRITADVYDAFGGRLPVKSDFLRISDTS